MKTITTFAALLVASLSAAPGLAQDAPVQSRTVAVSYADLDLRSDAGRDTFDSRIRNAIRQVCGEASSADLRGQNRVDACRSELASRVSLQRDVALAATQQSGTTIAIRR